jgi:hypothetical protein
MANSFLETLQQNTIPDHTSVALDVLNEFCAAIREYTDQKLECWLIPGFSVNLGQEWRVMLKPWSRDYEHILLRAYVPLSGFPTSLDLYGENLNTCSSEAILRKNLANFLKTKTVGETISLLTKEAADHAV